MKPPTVAVWCDDASHPAKRERVFVCEFVKPNIMWFAQPQRRRSNHGVKWWITEGGGTARSPEAGGDEDPLLHHDISCRFCKRPLTVRPGKLDAALDLIAQAGRATVTLADIRAILNARRR